MLKKRSLFVALLVALIVLAVVLVITLHPSKEKVFKIGASPVPHNEILEQVKDDFRKETGYEKKRHHQDLRQDDKLRNRIQ